MTSDAPQPRGGALREEARRLLTPALAADAYVSLPVPVVRGGAAAAAFFGATTVARPDGTNEDMYAPAVELTLDWATGRELDRRVLRAAAPAAGEAPVAAIRPLPFREPLTLEVQAFLDGQLARLDTLLEAVVRRYGAQPQRPAMDDGTRYLEQFEDLVPSAARTYYTALNPDFFVWVERGR